MVAYDLNPFVAKDMYNNLKLSPVMKAILAEYVEETARKIAKEEIEKFKKEFIKKQAGITE